MTAPAQTPAVSAPTRVASDLRKDDPPTAVELWKRRVAASPDAVAFRYHDKDAWQGMTFREADGIAREIAAGLVARGVVPGDRICIVSQTRLEWVLCDIAIMLAGGIAVPIYASNTAEQCEFIVRDAGAKVVMVEDAAQRDKLVGLRDKLFTVAHIIQLTGEPQIGLTPPPVAGATAPSRFVQSLAELRGAGRQWGVAHPGELDAHAETVAPESMFTIIYTSGTTGIPKGVVLTHDNLVAGACSAIRAMQIETIDVQYLFLPLAHVLGRELEWATIQMGCETAFSRGTAQIKEDLVAIRPTFMAGVPRIFEKFHSGVKAALEQGSGLKRKIAAWALRVGAAQSAALRAGKPGGGFAYWLADRLVFSKLRARLGLDRATFLISGGAPLAAEIAEFFHGAGILILEGYGLTETFAAAFLNTRERFRFGTVGPALDVVECKIADDGEILMRGPSVFRQYYNNAAATAESVEPDGWFHSGDIGHLEDGFLRITDRKKDLIVTAGGKKIAPQALENALKARSPLFSQVLVYGDKRPYCVALVTLSDDARKRFGGAEFETLAASPEVKAALQVEIDGLNGTLASYESIKKFAVLPADLTEASGDLTPKLSVKRKVVIDKYRSVIEELYRA
ncbi:MAG TPA: long-chain fatty acid--CoA ligase [Polyangia bacterium]